MSAVISRPSAAELERVMDALEAKLEAEQPMTFGQVRACVPELDVTVNVALDRLQTAGRVTRCIIAGRVVYHLPDWTPPKPAHRKRDVPAGQQSPSAVIVPRAATASISDAHIEALKESVAELAKPFLLAEAEVPAEPIQLTVSQQFVLMAVEARGKPMSSPELADALTMKREAVTYCLKLLRDKGLLQLDGQKRGALWSLTEKGQALMATSPQPAGTDSCPGSPSAPPIDATLDWHAASAEREARRRNAVPIANFPLPEAMSNTGEFEPETCIEPGATSLQIDDAKFAIWSDGRLEIDAGDLHLSLTKAATHRLFNFLDQFSSIEAH